MRVSRALPWGLMLALLGGCATGYQDLNNPFLGLAGGYADRKGPGELIKVSFAANGYTNPDTVAIYLMYRCAEIAKRESKPYFAFYTSLPAAVADKRSSERIVTLTMAGPLTYAYILLFDAPEPGLLSTDEVLTRLEPEVKPEVTK